MINKYNKMVNILDQAKLSQNIEWVTYNDYNLLKWLPMKWQNY